MTVTSMAIRLILVVILYAYGTNAARTFYQKPNFRIYHTQDALLRLVAEVVERNPTYMKLDYISANDEDYNVTLPVVTVEPGGWTQDHRNKIRLFMSFGEHGREIVTSEIALELLRCFEMLNKTKNCLPRRLSFDELKPILYKTVFKIVVVENPVGREIVENGEMCERKNGRGVDINRNWDINFGLGLTDPHYDPSEEYPGKHAFSEPETVILRDIAQELHPHVWIAFHSGTCAALMPYDHIQALPETPSASAQLQLLKTLKSKTLKDHCMIGSGGQKIGYVAHGTGTDYMYSILKVPLAFTWETYGNHNVLRGECYKMFNPITRRSLQRTLSMWTATVFQFLALLPDHPDIPNIHSDNASASNEGTEEFTASRTTIREVVTTPEDRSNVSYGLAWSPIPVTQETDIVRNYASIGMIPLAIGILAALFLVTRRANRTCNEKKAIP